MRQAQQLRAHGKSAADLPMRKNMKRQIQFLEVECFTDFAKVYADYAFAYKRGATEPHGHGESQGAYGKHHEQDRSQA